MMPRRVIEAAALPLFQWPMVSQIQRMEAERLEIQRRISLLPRNSDRAVELRARLKEITARQLALQTGKPS